MLTFATSIAGGYYVIRCIQGMAAKRGCPTVESDWPSSDAEIRGLLTCSGSVPATTQRRSVTYSFTRSSGCAVRTEPIVVSKSEAFCGNTTLKLPSCHGELVSFFCTLCCHSSLETWSPVCDGGFRHPVKASFLFPSPCSTEYLLAFGSSRISNHTDVTSASLSRW